MNTPARIVACHGRDFRLRHPESGQVLYAATRGKRVDFACGDWVHFKQLNAEQAVIEDHLPRQSLLYRQDAFKSKLIAANVTQMLVVLAAVPSPNELLLQRALLAAEAAHVAAVMVLNKADLPETAAWAQVLGYYVELGYPLITVSALGDTGALRQVLHGHSNIFLGQSGMGKSTLTNALLGREAARTGDISVVLDSGRHTTTHAQLYELDNATDLIDSPGLQAFGLNHLEAADLLRYMPDMAPFIGQCRFHNCTHRREPGCAVKEAVASGRLPEKRLKFLETITAELARAPQY